MSAPPVRPLPGRRPPVRRLLAGAAAVLAAGVVLAGCQSTDAGTHAATATDSTADVAHMAARFPMRADHRRAPRPAPTAPATPAPAPPAPGTPAPTAPASTPPPLAPAPAPAGPCAYPTPACTGVPAGTVLRPLAANLDGDTYRVTAPNQVLDGVHIAGNLLLTAPGTTIRNSQIDGRVLNEYAGQHYPFTISDSTVGPTTGCNLGPAVGEVGYTATRINIRNEGDGFRIAGDGVTITDSFVKLCSQPGFHSDGVQDYPGGSNVVFRHNTVDQRNAPDHTAPIFITLSSHVLIEDNLVMGGTSPLRVEDRTGGGDITVRDNKIVDKAWDFSASDSQCDRITFTGNQLVTIDDAYKITGVVGPASCY